MFGISAQILIYKTQTDIKQTLLTFWSVIDVSRISFFHVIIVDGVVLAYKSC